MEVGKTYKYTKNGISSIWELIKESDNTYLFIREHAGIIHPWAVTKSTLGAVYWEEYKPPIVHRKWVAWYKGVSTGQILVHLLSHPPASGDGYIYSEEVTFIEE